MIVLQKMLLLLTAFLVALPGFSQKFNPDKEIYLLVSGDDIGSSHAANLGCIESYQNGIMQSVELMPVCPWFPEAVKMLKDNPDLDVGIHLALKYVPWASHAGVHMGASGSQYTGDASHLAYRL